MFLARKSGTRETRVKEHYFPPCRRKRERERRGGGEKEENTIRGLDAFCASLTHEERKEREREREGEKEENSEISNDMERDETERKHFLRVTRV